MARDEYFVAHSRSVKHLHSRVEHASIQPSLLELLERLGAVVVPVDNEPTEQLLRLRWG